MASVFFAFVLYSVLSRTLSKGISKLTELLLVIQSDNSSIATSRCNTCKFGGELASIYHFVRIVIIRACIVVKVSTIQLWSSLTQDTRRLPYSSCVGIGSSFLIRENNPQVSTIIIWSGPCVETHGQSFACFCACAFLASLSSPCFVFSWSKVLKRLLSDNIWTQKRPKLVNRRYVTSPRNGVSYTNVSRHVLLFQRCALRSIYF